MCNYIYCRKIKKHHGLITHATRKLKLFSACILFSLKIYYHKKFNAGHFSCSPQQAFNKHTQHRHRTNDKKIFETTKKKNAFQQKSCLLQRMKYKTLISSKRRVGQQPGSYSTGHLLEQSVQTLVILAAFTVVFLCFSTNGSRNSSNHNPSADSVIILWHSRLAYGAGGEAVK